MNRRITTRAAALAAAGLLPMTALAACSSGTNTTAENASPSPSGCPITVSDAWVKAAENGMTAAFATLHNDSGAQVQLTAAATPASPMVELHEVVMNNGEMVMKEAAGGLTVPASGDLKLEPGGFHIMLMDLPKPIVAGDEVAFTLTCASGATVGFDAQVKHFTGGDEVYDEGSESASPMHG